MILTRSELNCLASYQFKNDGLSKNGKNRKENDYLLCIKKTGETTQIDKVRRVDVTLWEIVKRFFGCGKLKGCDLRLKSIAAHLSKLHLPVFDKDKEAYTTVHGIATRMVSYRKSGKNIPLLWENIAVETKKFHLSSPRFLFLTPLTTVGHLCAQVNILEDAKASEAKGVGGIRGDRYEVWYYAFKNTALATEEVLKKISHFTITPKNPPPAPLPVQFHHVDMRPFFGNSYDRHMLSRHF